MGHSALWVLSLLVLYVYFDYNTVTLSLIKYMKKHTELSSVVSAAKGTQLGVCECWDSQN